MNGALPPSSIEVRFTVDAHCAISVLPISVEPVNVTLRTIGFEVISPPIAARRNSRSRPKSSATIGSPMKSIATFKVPLPNGRLGKLAIDFKAIRMIGRMSGVNAAVALGKLLNFSISSS